MATQIHRPFRLKTTLGDDVLLLESFEGFERVSTPFRFVVRALSENANIDLKALLYKAVVLTIGLTGGTERHIHGNVKRMRFLEFTADNMAAYELEVVPWLWFLNLFNDCRIFQNLSVKEIIEKVFKQRGFSDFRWALQGSYEKREYCVQYRESDFNFVSRLMEDEGILYFFEQKPDKVTLVLTDTSTAVETCPHQAIAKYTPTTGGRLAEDTIRSISGDYEVQTGSATLTDYDFEKPATDLSATLEGGQQKGRFYDYPGEYLTKSEGDRYARIRLEEREARIQILRAEGNCQGLECGYKFKLEDHYRDDANTDYFITALEHKAVNTSYASNADPSAFEYHNRFEAIPAAAPYRPPRLAHKPAIDGAQTAVVVGKAGEEIWTDKYGRVKVLFHWDRLGSPDENSSCWIRVSHDWAGKNWGAIYTPRIGQEVIVSFLEGNPDRPIITGRVYNADQMPPYALPGEQTKSTLKSLSSKGGGGFNEIRFEDKKGSEQIFLHGEKDLDVRIKNDRNEWIGNNRHLIVTKDKYEKIKGDEHSAVEGKRVEKITKDHLLEIVGNQGIKITGNHSLTVTGNVLDKVTGNHNTEVTQNVYIKGLQIVIEASVGLTLKVGGNFITIDPSGVAVKGILIQLNSAGAALSGSPGQAVQGETPTAAEEADNDKPGGNTSSPAAHTTPAVSMSLDTLSPAAKAAAEQEAPERNAPPPSPGRSGRSQLAPEFATFPKNVDAVAVAQVLQLAAQTGVPFCEECEKAREHQKAV